ncbi:ABC transporter permease [Steroidobacter agaridevorans]|uniref:ABC transporter permease n=1 Tax=Steroidobacter agaridevorans TaxID=2695856 RepID=A0A829YBB0_9GAMM|nr:FtsX-like permease family protein [Steroidobacter agaridevorans]GFE80569.1 ABC transporter permease [Steroidobacter agaridevorans]
MWRNYLSAALRNLSRNRLYAAINIVGLAIGLAAGIFAGLYVREELSYERFIPGHESIYRVSMTRQVPGAPAAAFSTAYHRVSEWLESDFPEIQASSRLWIVRTAVRHGEFEAQQSVGFADRDFFRVFALPAIAGDLATALSTPDGIVLTRQAARKYFGEDMPIGKTLELDRSAVMRVTAVIEDLPSNTHLNFTVIASNARLLQELQPLPEFNVRKFEAHTYFSLDPATSLQSLRERMTGLIDRHQKFPPGIQLQVDVLPIDDIHLKSSAQFPLEPPGDLKTVYAIAAVGILIVLIAGINFVNLMTSRASQRAVEVGVRKAAGASRRDLVLQFIGESLIHVTIAMLVAVAAVELLMPYFNALLDRSLSGDPTATIQFEYWRDPMLALALVAAVLIIGLAAGFYPAMVLSAFRPIDTLKTGIVRSAGSFTVRQLLVVLQFGVLVLLILATAVIHRQTQFALNEGLRIDRNQVLLVSFRDARTRQGFQEALREVAGVEAVTSSHTAPTNRGTIQLTAERAGGSPAALQFTPVDFNFHEFYGLQPLAGRLFSRERGTDAVPANATSAVASGDGAAQLALIVNEATVRTLGFATPDAAVGQILKIKEWSPDLQYSIVGVIPDFPVDSIRVAVQPTVYFVDQNRLSMISARLNGRAIPETLTQINRLWQRIGEPRPIESQFLDEYYGLLYTDVRQQARLFNGFTVIALIIASLGLFGLSVFSAQQRTKEVGIRKAMGAGTQEIMRLLLWQFLRPVLIAIVLALPLGAWLMQRWLSGFAQRASIEAWLLIAAGAVVVLIGALTVAAHVILVARWRPAAALRYE